MNKKDNPKSEMIRIRVTPEEKKALFDSAKIAGVTLSSYVLGLLIGGTVENMKGKKSSEK